ncbi:hypothetical protein BV22DRAFT_1186030 [Leucogyrophana mollusca]|uniref:Uncharacterized protein n=1 Tax=Leucogyrophana mollusca TaxID=85980 RepID=A0ACB8B0X0_9AGAM|nr:hypothetical protein BV22DRAFT_1186030 [Leucogyrophana mollusca]
MSLANIPYPSVDAGILSLSTESKILGHILFLKTQVHGCAYITTHLMPPRQLLDTLVSHLNTTLTALSTALALRNQLSEAKEGDTPNATPVYLVIVLGPTIGAAKSRVMIGIHGLETKIWGERDDITPIHNNNTEFGGVDSESDGESDSGGIERELDDDEGEEQMDGPPDSDDESDATQSMLGTSPFTDPSFSLRRRRWKRNVVQDGTHPDTRPPARPTAVRTPCVDTTPESQHVPQRSPWRLPRRIWLARDNTQERKKKGKAKIKGVQIRSLAAAPLAFESQSRGFRRILVFTDGACLDNGKDYATGMGIAIGLGGEDVDQWAIPIDDSIDPGAPGTNQRAELVDYTTFATIKSHLTFLAKLPFAIHELL